MRLLTYITIGIALLLLIGGIIILILRRRGIRHQLSQEEEETAEGLQKVAARTGVRDGIAADVNEGAHGYSESAGSSTGDSGGGDGD